MNINRQLFSGDGQSQKRASENGEDMADVCADQNLSIGTNNTPNLIQKYDTTNSKSMASIPGNHMTLSQRRPLSNPDRPPQADN